MPADSILVIRENGFSVESANYQSLRRQGERQWISYIGCSSRPLNNPQIETDIWIVTTLTITDSGTTQSHDWIF